MLSHGYLLPNEQTLVRYGPHRAVPGVPSVQTADEFLRGHRVRTVDGVGFLGDGVDDDVLHSGPLSAVIPHKISDMSR